jgi:hypothetical protein
MTEITSLNFFNIYLLEPITVLTNFFIFFFCLYFYFKLNINSSNFKLKKYWRLFFLFFSFSSVIGALAHGFRGYLNKTVFDIVWLTMNLSSILITHFLLLSNIETISLGDRYKSFFKNIIVLISIVFVGVILLTNNFLSVKINACISILLTLFIHFFTYRNKINGSGFILFGFSFSILSVIVHSIKFSFSSWFNYKDISHVIMNISLFIIFIGVKQRLAVEQLVTSSHKN